ncbi:energy transducer TonB [Flagellimonas sp.]|uniref:energy transducer TonB n=1 Tax=Flagellimonas sp. TaxID=2058762 RepID=UPI003B5AD563
MEFKKNPKLELKKNSTLYFMIGLTAILLLAYLAMEWKTYYPAFDNDFASLNPDKELIEEAPITFQKLPPPPPPKIQTPPVIEVVDDEEDIIETVIESNEPDQDTEVMDVEDVDFIPEDIPSEVSFIVVEDVPVFPGCENEKTKEGKRACFQEMMQKHIRRNFKYPENAVDMSLQGKVFTQFTIQKDGSIGEVKMRGPHKILEAEAARILSKLPKMTPGKQRGTPVKVPFSIPIVFQLQ